MSELIEVRPNQYSNMRISEINRLGTDALRECVEFELQGRGMWEDPEVQWALNFGMEMHEGEQRKDGPYANHLLRATLWTVREFDTHDPEAAKAALLHDVIENHPKQVSAGLGRGQVLAGVTARDR